MNRTRNRPVTRQSGARSLHRPSQQRKSESLDSESPMPAVERGQGQSIWVFAFLSAAEPRLRGAQCRAGTTAQSPSRVRPTQASAAGNETQSRTTLGCATQWQSSIGGHQKMTGTTARGRRRRPRRGRTIHRRCDESELASPRCACEWRGKD